MATQPPRSPFGIEMQLRRNNLRLTQRQLAEKAGYSEIYIQRLESGRKNPPRYTLFRIADALNLKEPERANFIALAQRDEADNVPDITAPVPLTSFVGRENEVADLATLLGDTGAQVKLRLVTVTGPAGVGKTHLALFTANTLRGDFPDGAYLVDLAPVREPAFFLATIATTLGIVDTGQRSLMAALIAATKARRQLWILDNFEQIIAAAPLVKEILEHCPYLTIIATSRIPLRIRGEQEFPLAPLPIPGSQQQTITDEALELLASRKTRFLTLTGLTSTSQTRLALDVAARLHGEARDGMLVCDGADCDDATWLGLLAERIGVADVPVPTVTTLAQALQRRRLLLVLLNVDAHEIAGALIAQILVVCPRVRVLATRRQPLDLDGEAALLVPEMARPDDTMVGNLYDAFATPAVTLFMQRARSAKPDLALAPTSRRAVVEICRRLDGLPLALELAAARVRILSPLRLLHQLEQMLDMLYSDAPDRPKRQQTVRAAIDWSYQLLTPQEQQVLRALSVFAGGADLDALAAVCTWATRQALEGALAALVVSSLVQQREDEHGAPRFTLLETIRLFGREALAQAGEDAATLTRFGAHFQDLAIRAEARLTGAEQGAWIKRLAREHANLRVVLQWARQDGDGATGLALAGAIQRYWDIGGHMSEGRAWLGELLARWEHDADARPTPAYAKALYVAGYLAQQQGDLVEAERLGNRHLQLEQSLGNLEGEARALDGLAALATNRGAHEEAFQKASRSLELREKLKEPNGIATTQYMLGYIAHYRGELNVAVDRYQKSIALFTASGDDNMVANVRNNLGNVFRYQGNYVAAVECFDDALRRYQKLGKKLGVARVRYNQGYLALWIKDAEMAERLLAESYAIRRDADDRRGLALVTILLGEVACWQAQIELAPHYLSQAKPFVSSALDAELEALWEMAMGHLSLLQGDLNCACVYYQRALRSFVTINDVMYFVEWIEQFAHLNVLLHEWVRAAQLFAVALEQRQRLSARMPPITTDIYQGAVRHLRAALGDAQLAMIWEQSKGVDFHDVLVVRS